MNSGLVIDNLSQIELQVIVPDEENTDQSKNSLLEITTELQSTTRLDAVESWAEGSYTIIIKPNRIRNVAELFTGTHNTVFGTQDTLNLEATQTALDESVNLAETPQVSELFASKSSAEKLDRIKQFYLLFTTYNFTSLTPSDQEDIDYTNTPRLFQAVNVPDSWSTTLGVYPAVVQVRDEEFNIQFDYPGDWEITQNTETLFHLGEEYKVGLFQLTKDNYVFDISLQSMSHAFGFISMYCTQTADITLLSDNQFRMQPYILKVHESTFERNIKKGNPNSFIYMHEPYIFNKDPFTRQKEAESLTNDQINMEDYNLCVDSVQSSFIVFNTAILAIYRDTQAGIMGVEVSWEGEEANPAILEEVDAIFASLQFSNR